MFATDGNPESYEHRKRKFLTMKQDSQDRRRVYFNEYNVLMEKTAYLPLVSGLLRAYAETSDLLKGRYEFMPFLFHRDSLKRILAQYVKPSVAAFSVSMWNEQLNLKVAEEVKRLYPDCLIVFGGPHVPHHPHVYFERFPFIDVAVRGEGEEAFSEILTRFLTSSEFSGIAGVSWRDPATGTCIRNTEERPQSRDLDIYPSPYLEGLFEETMANQEDMHFQAIIETNRGCPFLCTFCFWGQGGLSRRYRFHGIDRVGRELEWCAIHRIRYVFNADSNFGMHPRDREIAQILVETKKKHGFPEKFRTCFGKNTDDKIYEIATLLHQHDLEKGITLARQSNDNETLHNVKRANIKLSTYRNLQARFNENNVPVYSEIILGLPGETYESWIRGIQELLQAGLKNQIITYTCEVYPNTEFSDPEYMKKFGIVTKRIRLTEIHGAIRQEGLVQEYQDIVITTNSMPLAEWRKMCIFSWTTMLLHSLKLAFFVLAYLVDRFGIRHVDLITYIAEHRMPSGVGSLLCEEVAHFEKQVDRLLEGHGRGHESPEFGNLYWDEEETSFLRISGKLDQFYDEMLVLLREFLRERNLPYDEGELTEAVQYQRMRIPSFCPPASTQWRFNFNFSEYFETHFSSNPVPLKAKPQILTVYPRDYQGDKAKYARQTILWGRKSGTMLTDVKWHDELSETVVALNP